MLLNFCKWPIVSQPSNDRDDVLMRVGVRYFDKNGINGSLEYSKPLNNPDLPLEQPPSNS